MTAFKSNIYKLQGNETYKYQWNSNNILPSISIKNFIHIHIAKNYVLNPNRLQECTS